MQFWHRTGIAIALALLVVGTAGAQKRVDIDLTRMSATFVYAQVFNMLVDQASYEGKTVRMRGAFLSFNYEADDTIKKGYACVIKDATACCAQGLEFEMPAPLTYPDDFPAEGTEITVSGTFHTFHEGDYDRIALINAQFE